jgi:hypothetical protein
MPDRRYSKPDPIAEDIIVIPDESQVDALAANTLTRASATKYSKAENVLQPKAFVVVFSNGEVREKNYFQWMMYHCARLRLEFFSNPVSPDDMLDGVKSKKDEYASTAGEESPDTYYLVTDVDHFYTVILRCQSDYEKEGVKLIVSNPCFEVWLYYSKRDDMFDGFVMPENPLKLSQEVKRFLNEQIPGGCNPKTAIFDIKANIANARKNYDEDGSGIPVLFATSMFRLAEEVLPFIEDEIEKEVDSRLSEKSWKSGKGGQVPVPQRKLHE